jgi:hypothetical protein
VAQLKYLGMTVTSQNLIQEEIKWSWFRVIFACGSGWMWNLVADVREKKIY